MKSAEKAGLRALKIGTKRNIAISVDPEKAASALELSKDRRIEDLERQVRFLETRLMYLKKPESLSSSHEKVKVLNELRQFYPLDELLRAAEIPRSTFYYHLKALSKPDKYADVKKRISEIYHENRGRYGYRRVTLSLHREGKQINHKAVQRLMGTLSLKAAIKVKRYALTEER
ncbi:IS150 protein InsAB [Escherichia coli]|nr:IS150 protein InsAB [Escherichia coli]